MRYRLRTLMILLAVGPLVLAFSWHVAWSKYDVWRWRSAIDICGHGASITVLADGTTVYSDTQKHPD